MPGTIQVYTQDAVEPTFAAAEADGMRFQNDGRTRLVIDNDGGTDRIVVVRTQHACEYGQLAHDDDEIPVAAGARVETKCFPVLRWGSPVLVVYDSQAGLSFIAVKQEAYAG